MVALMTAASAAWLSGCDPVINVAGANFPAWLLCAIIGGLGVAPLRALLLAGGLDAFLLWRPVFYLSSGLLIASSIWIVFFNRV